MRIEAVIRVGKIVKIKIDLQITQFSHQNEN